MINSGLSNGFFDWMLVPMRHKLFWIPLYLFIVAFVLTNFGRRRWLVLLFFGITLLISDTVSSKLIKKTIKRERPCHMEELTPVKRIPCSHGYSFTSSHATNHFAIGTFLFCLFSFFKWRWLFMLWASIIGFAQIYVGVHYPLDVIVGSLIGTIIGLISFNIFNRFAQNFKDPEALVYASTDS